MRDCGLGIRTWKGLVGWCSCSWAAPSADSQLNGHATVAAAAACDTKSQAQNGGGREGGGGGKPDRPSAYVKCLTKHMDIEWPVAGPQLYSSLANVCCD